MVLINQILLYIGNQYFAYENLKKQAFLKGLLCGCQHIGRQQYGKDTNHLRYHASPTLIYFRFHVPISRIYLLRVFAPLRKVFVRLVAANY